MSYETTAVRQVQIADAAIKVIAEQGLAKFTTRAVAAEVGITDGALFRHFKDKLSIVLAAMARIDEAIFVGFPHDGDDPVERIESFFRHRTMLVGSHSMVGRLVFSDQLVHAAGSAGMEMVRSWRMRSLGFLVDRATEAMAADQMREDLPAEAVAQVIQGVILTYALKGPGDDAKLTLEDRVDQSWASLTQLLGVAGSQA